MRKKISLTVKIKKPSVEVQYLTINKNHDIFLTTLLEIAVIIMSTTFSNLQNKKTVIFYIQQHRTIQQFSTVLFFQ